MERLKSYISDLARQDEHLGSLAHDLMREVKQDPKNEQAKHTAVLLHTTRKQLQNWKRQCALARSDPEQYVPVPVEKKLEWSREIVRDDIPEGGVEIMLQQMGDGKAWWDRESGYFKLDLGLGKDDSEERVIQMANKVGGKGMMLMVVSSLIIQRLNHFLHFAINMVVVGTRDVGDELCRGDGSCRGEVVVIGYVTMARRRQCSVFNFADFMYFARRGRGPFYPAFHRVTIGAVSFSFPSLEPERRFHGNYRIA